MSSSESRKGGKLSTPEIGDKPHQPSNFHFPQREFGKTSVVKRSFQHNWFQRWPWLHYDEEQDLAFCFTSIVTYKNNPLHSIPSLENTFVSTGFSNWKDAIAKLPTQLEVFSHNIKCEGEVVLSDVLKFFRNCIPGQLELMSEVCKLVKLLLVMPATNAESERSFSADRRIKTYLRSTMSQQQLNHLMLLHVHKSHTDHLNLVDVIVF